MEAQKMRNLVFMVAFGDRCLEEFDLIYPPILGFGNDVLLITDKNIKRKGVEVLQFSAPEEKQEMYKFRVHIYRVVDFSLYDSVCYMDTDIVMKRNIFDKYKDGIYAAKEPDVMMDNEHFCELLTNKERIEASTMPAINSGFFVVPKRLIDFWEHYEEITIKSYEKRPWIAEQHAMNWIYFHERERWEMKLFDREDIGWPVKGIEGKYVEHYICLKNEDKIGWMRRRMK